MSYEDLYNYIDEIIELEDIKHPNLTLDELINITKQKAIRLFRKGHITENINRTQLFRSIIMAASRVEWSKTDTRGIREFWYNPCKPIFYRIFGSEIDAMGEGQITKICDQLSRILSVMVQSGLVRYLDLGIVDFRTKRMLWESREGVNCWSKVVLFVEKDSAYVHLRPIKELLNITLLSGGGVSKTALNEFLMDRLPKGKYTLFTVTDYDPWGFFISGECFMKMRRMGWDLEVIRICLDTDQVEKEITQNQKYPVKMDNKGTIWAPIYGILGRLRTVIRTRKAMIEDPETGKKRKVDEEYVAYKGRKGWGLEIEAVSGQQGGAQALREIVLAELLKHLKEEDRLDEIKTPLWDEIEWDEETNPFTEEEWKNYEEHGLDDFDDFITEEIYDEFKEGRDAVWKMDRKPVTERASYIIKEDKIWESNKYDLSQEIDAATKTAKELATRCLEEQITELYRQKGVITRKIESAGFLEEKKMVDWLLFSRLNLSLLVLKCGKELKTIDGPYNEDIEELKKQKAICDAIRVTVYAEWLDEERDHLFEGQTNEEEEISFGLMPGVHLDILKEGGDISDLFTKVEEFDKDRIYDYIWNLSQNDERDNIVRRLADKMELYGDEDREKAWHEKWAQYLEVN